MSPEVERLQITEIDHKAEVERARVRFDINLLEQYEGRYRELLLPNGHGDEDPDLALYKKFVKFLDHLESDAIRVSGVVVYRQTPAEVQNTEDVEVKLGWKMFSQPMLREGEAVDPTKQYAYFKHPTELGIQIIDARRAVQGKSSVEAARNLARSSWDDALGTRST